jgi:catechol 2,3-dioxygenase-like lactoylglutathione lyase family enzyme
MLKTMAIAAAAAGLPTLAHAETLHGTAINHVSYSSAHFLETRDFYTNLFGFQVSDADNLQLFLWAGDSLISAKNTPRVPRPFIDHIGLTVDPWDPDAVKRALQGRGFTPRVNPNDVHDPHHLSMFVRDPNGYNLQLGAPTLETKPAPVPSTAPLKAVAINHISYQCADYRKTRDFYAGLLGVPVSHDDGQQAYLWFGDAFMVVRNSPTGSAMPVIDHMAWTLADWDAHHVASVLTQHGLEAKPDPAGLSVMTKDVNGYPLQLCSKDLEKRP